MENEAIIETLKTRLADLKKKVRDLRKKGFNTKTAELMLMNIPSKIQMADITNDNKDINKVTELLGYVKKEIDEISKEKALNK